MSIKGVSDVNKGVHEVFRFSSGGTPLRRRRCGGSAIVDGRRDTWREGQPVNILVVSATAREHNAYTCYLFFDPGVKIMALMKIIRIPVILVVTVMMTMHIPLITITPHT